MQQTNDNQLLQAAKDLIAIKSTADNPTGLQAAYAYMLDMVRSHAPTNVITEEFESGGKPSFLAYRGPQRPKRFKIILNGHVDVVPGDSGQYKPVIKDGKLYGRGAYDMKAACVILAQVFCEFVDKVPYPLALQIVTDEETSGEDGANYQIQKQGVRGDFIICGEGGRASDAHEIANEAKGLATVRLGFRGTSAHGAYPWKGDNAASKAAHFASRLSHAFPAPNKATGDTTVCVTGIVTHDAVHNRIPESTVVTVDTRYAPDDARFGSKDAVAAFYKTFDPDAEILEYINYFAPVHTDPDNSLLQQLKETAERIENTRFSLVRRKGASDARFYSAVGDPAIEFGIAGENHHADDEYVSLAAFDAYLQTMRAFLTATIEYPSEA